MSAAHKKTITSLSSKIELIDTNAHPLLAQFLLAVQSFCSNNSFEGNGTQNSLRYYNSKHCTEMRIGSLTTNIKVKGIGHAIQTLGQWQYNINENALKSFQKSNNTTSVSA